MSELAYFGGGCFWCTEAVFGRVKGVLSVTPGYAGGKRENPTYEQVSTGATGHAEVIKVEFDPSLISYAQLLDIFWHVHDPTSLNKQGADEGTQYRSVILYGDDTQKIQADTSLQMAQLSGEFSQPIVTKIEPLDQFYTAEEYHKNYFDTHSDQPYCQVVIAPKLQKFLKKYSNQVK
jgi:peptide-methionine (S)-S-oxide reductase